MKKGLLLVMVMAGLMASSTAFAGDCYSVRVEGCGKKARVCVNTSSNNDADTRAREWFKKANSCSNPVTKSYSSSCSEAANDKCDAKL